MIPAPTRVRPTPRNVALGEAVRFGLLGAHAPVIGLLDVDGVLRAVDELRTAFEPAPVLHTFAAKACALVPVLRLMAQAGMGCEVASAGELHLALAAGFPPERLILDNPAKTVEELRFALTRGIAINLDNFQELARVDALRSEGVGTGAPIGLRVNPQVGTGSIGAMSTATQTSKFGIALGDPGAVNAIVAAFAQRPWLSRLHAHVGSQGCSLELMAAGIKATYKLAEHINTLLGRFQVRSLDIGGGLPVNFADDEVKPTYADYVDVLRARVPGLLDGRYTLLTEFGRSLVAKSGTVASLVEYTKTSGGRPIAITHAGAQVATRTVFMPNAWPLRVGAHDANGRPKEGPTVPQDIAGPCCFAGDLTAVARPLPLLEPGDVVALHDTGAYYFSTHFAYNSLPRPAVYGYRVGEDDRVRFAPIRDAQSIGELVQEGGDEHGDSLVGLLDPAPEESEPAG
ncbi:diaminopimelate decarboxylase [Embleya hyalina]|uniref:Diaminopimelate decarboxylase n=1 Tax=Embleya hyalina TaxID=516124 RepID=A0A401YQR3_9ACTN|nr:diaminopimelate decarboxylase [Embleya hyalina]GCD96940.1 diaminopimelate decarboxylase [Embleya hyalina]